MAVAYATYTGMSAPVKIFDATTDGGPCSAFLIDYGGVASNSTGVIFEAKANIRGTLKTVAKMTLPDVQQLVMLSSRPNKIIEVWITAIGGAGSNNGAIYGAGAFEKENRKG